MRLAAATQIKSTMPAKRIAGEWPMYALFTVHLYVAKQTILTSPRYVYSHIQAIV